MDHLSSCPLIIPPAKVKVDEIRAEQERKRKLKCEEVKLVTQEQSLQQEVQLKEKGLKQGSLRASMSVMAGDAADKAVAEFFYANGLPFSVADTNPQSYYQRMIRAIQGAPSGYIPPNKNKLAGGLIDSCWL